MNAITLLKNDHKTMEDLFKRFEKLGPRAMKTKQDVVERIIRELSIHAVVEEMVLYPAIRGVVGKGEVDDLVLESLEEHHIVKTTLWELERTAVDDERFDAKVRVLMESVRHHVEEEENDLFPEVNKMFDGGQLDELGDAMARLKKTAPTRPHPNAPDEPPGNLIAGAGAALMDRALDAGRKLVGR